MDIQGKKVAVLGLNQEGLGFLKALHRKGAKVTGFGTGPYEETRQSFLQDLGKIDIPLFWKPQDGMDLSKFDFIVYTTHFGQYADLMEHAKSKGVPAYWDLDFTLPFLKAPIIGITGTNGKSTTLAILGDMLKKQGLKITMTGGDFDPWASRLLDVGKFDFHLMELSSQRLENSLGFHPHIAILLNIFPSHRARHKEGIVGYFKAKAKIFKNQNQEDYLIYDAGANNVRELIRRAGPKSKPVMFSLESPVTGVGVFRKDNSLIWQGPEGEQETYALDKRLRNNLILIMNFMAAISAAKLSGVEAKNIQEVMGGFSCLPHRMESVRTVSQVSFIDDARATNFGATIWALYNFEQPVWLIMGGEPDPASDFDELQRFLPKKTKGVFCVGAKRQMIKEKLEGHVMVQALDSLQEAVEAAYRAAEPNQTVLFSPGCHPDVYLQGMGNERGQEFQKIVQGLPEIQRTIRSPSSFTRI